MSIFLGIDTSNYTTSVALFDSCGNVISKKRLLPVKKGERGIRQSDAVFLHTKAIEEIITINELKVWMSELDDSAVDGISPV